MLTTLTPEHTQSQSPADNMTAGAARGIFETLGPVKLAYCDYIAARIKRALSGLDPERILSSVGNVKSDLHPAGGYLLTTKKTLQVTDRNGTLYRVTVEEVAK